MESVNSLNLQYIFLLIYRLFTDGNNIEEVQEAFLNFWQGFTVVSLFVSLLLLVGIVYASIRLSQIRKEENEIYGYGQSIYPETAETPVQKNERWEKILQHVKSENPSDWRLAILEADIILSEMMQRMGYQGETLGEKLKQVERSDFTTIDSAWEAHKIRNLIAHQGSDYILTHREAQRVIALYRVVFEEFNFI